MYRLRNSTISHDLVKSSAHALSTTPLLHLPKHHVGAPAEANNYVVVKAILSLRRVQSFQIYDQLWAKTRCDPPSGLWVSHVGFINRNEWERYLSTAETTFGSRAWQRRKSGDMNYECA